MYTMDLILLVINEAGEEGLRGRTLLQKKLYFLSVLMGVNLDFTAHRYGPYSSSVAGHLASLVGHGFLREATESFKTDSLSRSVFGEIRRHTYSLTEEADEVWNDIEKEPDFPRWKDALKRLNAQPIAGDFNKLSIAAKVHYIVNWREKTTVEEVRQVAKEYGWNVSEDDIEGVLSFLTELGLVSAAEA